MKRIAVRVSKAKPFGIDRCMHIHDTLQSLRFGRDGAASNILAAEIAAFTTHWCYAKITPAALHRGNLAKRGLENREAVGCRLEFRSRDLSRLHRQRTAKGYIKALRDPKLSKPCPRLKPLKQATDG
ncbi:MAG: hypothetical protein WDN50_15195 [Bradyrhizobium sp.]